MDRPRAARRVLYAWLPRLGVERRLRCERRRLGADAPDPSTPFALLAEEKNALRLSSVSETASAAGLAPGTPFADARALRPDLRTAPADPHADRATLLGMARWAGRYSPLIGVEGEDGLTMDLRGVAHLYGGEASLAADFVKRLNATGFTVRAAIADGKGAAWAMARFAANEQASALIVPTGENQAWLAAAPPEALRLSPKAVEGLRRLGVKTIGALANLPRGAVSRRFGAETLRRLDQAHALESEPLTPLPLRRPFSARLSLPEPIALKADLMAALDRLLARVLSRLAAEGLGARELRFELRRVDASIETLEVGLAQVSRDDKLIRRLFDPLMDTLDAGFGIDAVRLEAVVTERAQARQNRLSSALQAPAVAETGSSKAPTVGVAARSHAVLGAGAQTERQTLREAPEDAMIGLLSRLGGRLGFDKLTRLAPTQAHPPDRASVQVPASQSEPEKGWRSAASGRPPRPLVMFDPEPVISAVAPRKSPPVKSPPTQYTPLEGAPAVGSRSAHHPKRPSDEVFALTCADNLSEIQHVQAAQPSGRPPEAFRWRGRLWRRLSAVGPERIAPEWWLDDPAWAEGVRDYWRVEAAPEPAPGGARASDAPQEVVQGTAGAEEAIRIWMYWSPEAARLSSVSDPSPIRPNAPSQQRPEIWRAVGVFP